MHHPTLSPLASLYSMRRTGPFSNGTTEQRFAHGMPLTVSVFEPRTETASRCLAQETRMPASFYSALVSSPDGSQMLFSTGSGDEAGYLLERLCQAFAAGDAVLSCDYDDSVELKVARPSQEDGRLAWHYRTDNGWHQVLLEEACSLFGTKPMVAVYVRTAELADALAAACAEGVFDFEPPKKKDLESFAM